jgi:hypothetical protein
MGTAQAGISYLDPAGGWTYLYAGDQCATAYNACLDGTWHHYDAGSGGSDAWDGSAPGQAGAAGVAPAPGGAGIFTEGDTAFLRIQDCGDPRDTGWGDPSNRKITFAHNITTEVSNAASLLNDGVTLSFRARIPTTAPLDPIYPDGAAGPQSWITSGYNIHDDGYGVFGIKQGTTGLGIVCFSLAMDSDEGDITGGGLTMNKRAGTAASANVDSYDSGGTENTLTGFDPTTWHEFWIQIVGDTSGGGTHKVTIWMDGDIEAPQTFHVTAGTKHEDTGGGWSGYLVMSLGRTNIYGSQDIDFFGYKAGLHAPKPARNPEQAADPSPANKSTEVLFREMLSWSPGESAQTHDVYLGTSLEDVNTASRANPMGVLVSQDQDASTYDPAGALAYGQTYYWRIDEVSAAPGSEIFKGDVWSFTVEPYGYPIESVKATASSSQPTMGPENTVNRSGLDDEDRHSAQALTMWLSGETQPGWIQYEFDKAYKLHELWVWNSNQEVVESFAGFGLKDVTIECSVDANTWTPVPDVPEFAPAMGQSGYVHNTTVSLGGVLAKYVRLTVNTTWGGGTRCGLSEVRFFYIPLVARAPKPQDGATDVELNAVLSWRPGREAASHMLFFSTDANAVALGALDGQMVDDHSYDPPSMTYGTTYYWRVDEVNNAMDPGLYEGPVWSFTTRPCAVVDDFENYNDSDDCIFDTWVDGVADKSSGSMAGYMDSLGGTFGERTIVHTGSQSMPVTYDNTSTYSFSEVTRTFDTARDWTANGIRSLSLYIRGASGNTGTWYLKINDKKVVYYGEATDIAATAWLPWNIDLSTVSTNLKKVTKLTIGVEGAGTSGIFYVDDIRLYGKTPEFITPTEPGAAGLLAQYDFEGNANDSSGRGLNGTVKDGLFVSPGKLGQGKAVQLNDAGYVDLGNPPSLDFGTADWSVTAWFKTNVTGTGDENKGTIFAKGGDNTGGHRYCLIMSETTEGVVSLVTDDDVTKVVVNATSATNNNEWHSVVGQRKGTLLEIYIDGQLQGSASVAAAYNLSGTSQHNAYIGAITNHADSTLYKLYIGLIDDVRIYDRALSEGEVLGRAGRTAPMAKPF